MTSLCYVTNIRFMKEIPKPKVKIRRAIALAGNKISLANALGVNKSSITIWDKSGRVYLPSVHSARLALVYPELVEK